MWVLVVLTFGFVSTDKVLFQEFSSKEKCEAAQRKIVQLDKSWKDANVRAQDVLNNKRFAPQAACLPK